MIKRHEFARTLPLSTVTDRSLAFGLPGLVVVCLYAACGDAGTATSEDGSSSGSSSTTGSMTTQPTTDPTTSTTDPTTTTTPTTTDPTTDPTTTTSGPTTDTSSTGDASSSSTTAVTASTGSTGTTGEPGVCGDGVVDDGEACDDANADNTDDCLDTCALAMCGDGEVQAGVEECDDANLDDLDGCTTTCDILVCGPASATRGSAIAISADDSRIVVANRDSGTVSIFAVDYGDDLPAMTLVDELAVGGEPWQVAIDRCGTAAYVILRRDQKVVEITDLGGEPELGAELNVGSEPTGIALTPNGTRLYVANWVDGTLTVIDPAIMAETGTVDLNAALVADPAKFLGDVASRPALAHPRSLAITSNGDADDADEQVLVTEYFAQRTAPEAPDGKNGDIDWAGIVYKVAVADDTTSLIQLPALTDTGFADSLMKPTGCFPNQLQSITIAGELAYVSSICASPVGPIGPKVNTHPVVSVFTTATGAPVPAGTANLARAFDLRYTMQATPDTSARRMPHVVADLAFAPESGTAYLTANGADALFRADYDPATGALQSVGAAMGPDFIDLASKALQPGARGQNPVGVAIANALPFAFVANDVTRNVTAIDLGKQAIAGSDMNDPRVQQSAALPFDAINQSILRGKRFFNTGLGRWSFNGQAWGSCQACHADGLSDNVTWYFARGPRQSHSLDGSYSKKDPSDHRVFLWTSVFDELADVENNTRGVSGGVGALVKAADPMMDPQIADRIDIASAVLFPPAGAVNLNGSTQQITDNTSVLKDWNDITRYVQTLRSPRAPSNLAPALVSAGEAVFKDLAQGGACQGCHGGDKWTISRVFYTPSGAGNEALKAKAWDQAALVAAGYPAALLPATTPANQRMRFGNAANDQLQCMLRPVGTFGLAPPAVGVAELRADMMTPAQGDALDAKGYNPPSLLGLAVGAPYFHAGNARTLEELLSPVFGVHAKALTKNAMFLTNPADVQALVAYLLSIDGDKSALAIPPIGPAGGDFCQQ